MISKYFKKELRAEPTNLCADSNENNKPSYVKAIIIALLVVFILVSDFMHRSHDWMWFVELLSGYFGYKIGMRYQASKKLRETKAS
jgi:hypothetical protein